MIKRLLSLLLVLCTLLSALPTAALADSPELITSTGPQTTEPTVNPENPFTDVDEDDWCYDAVQYVRMNGIFNGTTTTTFSPNNSLTRGMFVTVLGRMAGVDPSDYSGDTGFTDVPTNKYYAPYISWAVKYGITNGVTEDTFCPNNPVTRQQMAAFFVRYFEAFDVDYETGANITTIPADLDSVSNYAKDAVLKLWKQGLLNGNGVSFNPTSNASRAHAATLCMRADKAVDTWYSEPGVASERVSIDPATGEAENNGGTVIIPNNPNYDYTTYYEVEFKLADGQDATGVTLPETKTYAAGTEITLLPTPHKQNGVFLGWYYDAAAENRVGPSDTLTRNVTLYAKMGEVTAVSEQQTPNYITVTVPAGSVGGYTISFTGNPSGSIASFVHVSSLNEAFECGSGTTPGDGEYIIVGNTVVVNLEPGQTYSLRLAEDAPVQLKVGTEPQPSSVRVLNIITEKNEVQNLTLNGGVKYLPFASVSDMTGTALDGLFVASVNPQDTGSIQQNKNEGTFTYDGGDLAVGDTVAIYEGTRPDERTDESMNEAVAYVKITAIDGTSYSYETAESEEVLFTPDVLPISTGADTDDVEGQITVSADALDFTDDKYTELGLDSQTAVEQGDFIAFYTGDDPASGTSAGYGKIASVTQDGDTYIITYTTASQDEVLAAMDLYSTRNEEIELTPEEIAEIERQMKEDAEKSGFVVEAAEYLTALAIETDGFQELSDDLDMDLSAYSITFADGTPVDSETMDLMAVSAKITTQSVEPSVTVGDLVHFTEDGDPLKGIRAELIMTFTVEVGSGDNKLEITLEAIFEQEVLININTSGGAIWKWKWIFPYIYDYELNANIDLGTYTGIGVTATAKTVGEEEESDFSWKMSTGNKAGDKILSIGEQITDLMAQKEEFMGKFTVPTVGFDGEEVEVDEDHPTLTNGGLAEKYADMMENAEESWIDIVRVEIFSSEGHVDPFHILCYGISADFVVSANLYVTLGMTFEYGVAKRYNFSLMLFHKKSTNETIDLEEAHYQFDFYVMGTVGIRAGVELEVAVGLFSLKLDSIGICAETGAYAQLWGYFYYSLSWSESEGKSTTCSGAMLIEIGLYLTISFKAQLFSNEDLTYQPTIYENEWPLLTIGEAENVYDFAYEDDDEMLAMEVKSATEFTLSSDLFAMNYMDMKSGELHGTDSEDGDDDDEEPDNPEPLVCDNETESHYTITLSNPRFTYNPDGNIVTVDSNGTTEETCEITIRWNNGTLAFSARPIERTLTIEWSDPANARFIAFDSKGGSAVSMISGAAGTAISAPANPTKIGYTFAGWYQDAACTTPFTVPSTMPNYLELTGNYKGITVYAKWDAAPNQYVVKHYHEQLNGTYRLAQVPLLDDDGNPVLDANEKVIMVNDTVDEIPGLTGDPTAAAARTYAGFTAKPFRQTTIAADGSTVIEIYYYRNTYTVNFTYGVFSEGNEPLTYTAKYGATLYAPSMTLGGYDFTGYAGLTTDADGAFTVTGNATYNAMWTASENTPYRVEYYVERTYDDAMVLSGDNAIVSATGTTNSTVTVDSCKLTGDAAIGLVFDKATVNGTEVTETTVAADGSTVIKMYYTRARKTLNFDAGEGTLAEGDDTRTGKYGAPVTLPTPTRDGYTFLGWYTDEACETLFKAAGSDMDVVINTTGETMPLYAKWEPKGDTPYTVKHCQQNVSGEGYTLIDTEYKTGMTGGTAAAEARDYEGFETGVVEDTTIAGDGTTVVEVKYDRKTYNVNFNSNEGSSVQSLSGIRYKAVISAPDAPTKNGYDFAGWYKDAALTDAWSFTADTVTDELTLYAKWEAKGDTPYTVEHYQQNVSGDGYTIVTADTEDKSGTTNGQTAAAAKDYTGFTAQAFEQETIAANGSTVVKIYYTRNQYTLTFKPDNDGDDIVSTLYYGEDITEPETDPTKTGYTFANWGSVAATMPAANTTYTAQWTANQYTVVFNSNSGKLPAGVTVSGTMDDQPFNYDETKALTSNAYVLSQNSGYTFLGWAADENAATAQYNNGVEVSNLTDVNGATVTLYAVWQKGDSVEYTVKHYKMDLNGEYSDDPIVQELSGIKGALTAAQANTYEGFTAPTDAQVAQLQQVLGDEPVVIDIYYTRNQHTLTFKPDNGGADIASTLYYGESITAPTGLEKTGHTFVGWGSVAATMPDSDLTYTAQWDVNKYTITFDTDGGSAVAAITQEYGTNISTKPADPTKEGNTFTGWDKAIPATMPAENMTITASWNINQYTITFNTDGGGAIAPIEQDYNTAVNAPANPEKTGYTFVEWSPVLPEKMPAENKTHTATWRPNTYTVKFHANGGEGSMADQLFTYDSPAALSANAFTKENYAFQGWATEANGDVVYTNGQNPGNMTEVQDTVIDLYAVWAQSKFTLTYSGAGVNESSSQYSAGESVTLAAAPERDGYTFNGWEIDGTTYAAEAAYTMPAKHVTATAQWTLNTYTINYVFDQYDQYDATDSYHAVNSSNNPSNYTGAEDITLAEPTKKNYTFRGWYTTETFEEGTLVTKIAKGETGEKTLYAKWVCTVTFTFQNNAFPSYTVEVTPKTYLAMPEIPEIAQTATTVYTPNGWNGDNYDYYQVGDEVSIGRARTFEAQWTETDRTYTVYWYKADGTVYSYQTVTYDQDIYIEEPVGEGVDSTTIYTQAGWEYNNSTLYATSGTTTIRELVNEAVPDSNTLHFYPVYDESTRYYTVKFYSGIKGLVTEKYEYGDTITVPTTINNYTKNGVSYTPTWYTSSNTSSSDGIVWDFDNGTVTKDGLTLYARWRVDGVTDYNGIVVGGFGINDSNAADIPLPEGMTGTASYDATSKTLTLNNVSNVDADGNVTVDIMGFEGYFIYINGSAVSPLTIVLNGECKLKTSASAIYARDLTIKGNGDATPDSLSISSGDYAIYVRSTTSTNYSLTVDGCTLNLNNTAYGLTSKQALCCSKLTLKGGANVTSVAPYNPITTSAAITFAGPATLTLEKTAADSKFFSATITAADGVSYSTVYSLDGAAVADPENVDYDTVVITAS